MVAAIKLTASDSASVEPSWSPDGTKIAFARFRSFGVDIYVMNADGTNPVRLTNDNQLANFEPKWSPDGSKIVFGSISVDNIYEVRVMNADGSNQFILTGAMNIGNGGGPIWSPDSQKLLIRSFGNGNSEIYAINVDGTNLTNLTNSAAGEFDYDWQAVAANLPPPSSDLQLGSTTSTAAEGDNDEFVEGGESGKLIVEILNKGTAAADTVNAVLTTTTTGVTILSGASQYPVIQAGGSAVNSMPFVFSLDESVPCGQEIKFQLNLTYDNAAHSRTLEFTIQSGQPGSETTTVGYAGAPVDIPDGDENGVNVPIEVVGFSGFVSELRFRVGGSSCTDAETAGISHTWNNDLVIKLTSPQGTTITLLDGVGGSGDNFCNVVLDDKALAGSIQSLLTESAPHTGTFKPREPMSIFRGENPNGIWNLNVSDRSPGETGTVRDVSLEFGNYACSRDVVSQDLSLSMTGNPNPVEVDSELAYTLTVANGQNASTAVQVINTLPGDVTFVSANASRGSCSRTGSIVNCSLGDLRAYGLEHINIVVKPNSAGDITNTATVTSGQVDTNQSNNTASATTTVTRLADLVISNTDSPDPVPMGDSTTYTIKVTNKGPSAATGVTVVNRFSSGADQTNVIGNLAVNATATVVISASGSTPGTMSNEASVTANEVDPHPENNYAAQSTRVVTLFSLEVREQGVVAGCPGNNAAGRTTGVVQLNSAAPAGGAVVMLTTSNPKITVPPSVTIQASNSWAEFDIHANGTVSDPQTGEITASFAGTSLSQPITVRPISVSFINTFSTFQVVGGNSFNAEAVLECTDSPVAITVTLSTNLPSVAFIQSPPEGFVVIPAGQSARGFTVGTNHVSTVKFVTIQGTANGHTGTRTIQVNP